MEALNAPCLLMDDDLLNFSLLDDEDDDLIPKNLSYSHTNPNPNDQNNPSFPEFAEEELEWLLNKDAFPALETALDIIAPNQNHLSPVSVLENSTSTSSNSNSNSGAIMSCWGTLPIPASFPVRSRTKRRRRRRRVFPELPAVQGLWWNQVNIKNVKPSIPKPAQRASSGDSVGRKCQHCQAEKTPQWRAGPMGPKTLCNACGVRYKSGRLVPEYRPASSPTFSSELHSNSHRKIMEMRKQTHAPEMMMMVTMTNEVCGYRVG